MEHSPTGIGPKLRAFAGFITLSLVAGVAVAASAIPGAVVAHEGLQVFESLPASLTIDALPQASTLYGTSQGKEVPIASFYAQDRVEVPWNAVAPTVKSALVATEDPRFYQHGALDFQGTLRAAFSTLVRHQVQGGSSITQQYVKNVLVEQCEVMTVDPNGSAKARAREQKRYEQCYQNAAGVDLPRKIQELKYAVGLEKKYSKRQILMGYLNIVLFGGHVYGIQAAAEHYYGVSAKDLTLDQSATLIAMVNNPANLRIDLPKSTTNGAANGYKLTKDRRDYVLGRMLAEHKITKAQHDTAVAKPITPHITPVQSGCMSAGKYDASFFCDYVQRVIEQSPTFGKTATARLAYLSRGGLKIYTTLNLDLQQKAQAAVSRYIPPTSPALDLGAASVSTEVGTGRIVTMVQNRPYDNTGTPAPGTTAVNYNTDVDYGGSQGFQTGSAYKAFDLIEWLKEGHSLYDEINATRHVFPQSMFHESPPCNNIGGEPWRVANDESSASVINVMRATAESVNTAFARMATQLDLCGIKKDAQALLVHAADPKQNPLIANPSSVLGTNYIAPLTMATAYAGLANKGVACSPIAIDRIVNSKGKAHAVPKSKCSTHHIDPNIAAGVILALKGVLQPGGTAASANPHDGVPIFGKTGTTDNSLENWLVTSTTKIAQATWVGNVSGSVPLRSQIFRPSDGSGGAVNGGNVKFRIAQPILAALNAQYGGQQFPTYRNTAKQTNLGTGGPTPGSSNPSSPAPSTSAPQPSPTQSAPPEPAPAPSAPAPTTPPTTAPAPTTQPTQPTQPPAGTGTGAGTSDSGAGAGSGTGAGTGSGPGTGTG